VNEIYLHFFFNISRAAVAIGAANKNMIYLLELFTDSIFLMCSQKKARISPLTWYVIVLGSEIDAGVNKCVAEYAVTKASLAIIFKASSHFEKRQLISADGGHKPHIKSSTPKSLTAPFNIPRVIA
jgi:hypothetical protein